MPPLPLSVKVTFKRHAQARFVRTRDVLVVRRIEDGLDGSYLPVDKCLDGSRPRRVRLVPSQPRDIPLNLLVGTLLAIGKNAGGFVKDSHIWRSKSDCHPLSDLQQVRSRHGPADGHRKTFPRLGEPRDRPA